MPIAPSLKMNSQSGLNTWACISLALKMNSPIWVLDVGGTGVPLVPALGVGAPNLGYCMGSLVGPIAPALGERLRRHRCPHLFSFCIRRFKTIILNPWTIVLKHFRHSPY